MHTAAVLLLHPHDERVQTIFEPVLTYMCGNSVLLPIVILWDRHKLAVPAAENCLTACSTSRACTMPQTASESTLHTDYGDCVHMQCISSMLQTWQHAGAAGTTATAAK
jgi:hypothetical protein